MDEEDGYIEGPCDLANAYSFADLVARLELSREKSSKEDKMEVLFPKEFVKSFKKQTLFPIIRLVLPGIDDERMTYGIRENGLKKLVCDAYNLQGLDRQKIEKYKDASIIGDAKYCTHFPLAVEYVLTLKKYGASASDVKRRNPNDVTILAINNFLNELRECGSQDGNAKDRRLDVFRKMINKLSPTEMKYLLGIILRDLKMDFKDTLLRWLHPDAVSVYNSHLKLRRLCAEIRDWKKRIVTKVRLFHAFSPMLCYRPNRKRNMFFDAINGFEDNPFIIENKFDGERLLIHYKRGHQSKFLSRGGTDLDKKYKYGVLQSLLDRSIDPSVSEVILDGELLGYDTNTQSVIPFGSNRTVANETVQNMDMGRQLWVVLFDCLYVVFNNHHSSSSLHKSITNEALHRRRDLLREIITEEQHRITISQPVRTVEAHIPRDKKVEYVQEAMGKVILESGEGLVLKNLNSPYILDGRHKSGWVKVKPEYHDQLIEAIDVLILAGYFGSGRSRSGGVSHFMIGVLKSNIAHHDDEDVEFYTIGKVGMGYNVVELESLRKRLEPYARKWDQQNIPKHFCDWKPAKADDTPDFWYEPKNSVVLSINGAEVVKSENWSALKTIRFPRVDRIRTDIPWNKVWSIDDVDRNMAEAKSKRALNVTMASSSTTARKKQRKQLISQIPAHFQTPNLDEEQQIGTIFAGKTFHVVEFDRKNRPIEFVASDGNQISFRTHTDVYKVLVRYGAAKVLQNLPRGTKVDFVLVESLEQNRVNRASSMMTFDKHDLIYLDWVVDSLQKGVPRPILFKYYAFVCKQTVQQNPDAFNEYRDNVMQPLSGKMLKLILAKVPNNYQPHQKHALLRHMLQQPDDPLLVPHFGLRGAYFYFHNKQEPKNPLLETLELVAPLYGAQCLSEFNPDLVTHVVVPSNPDAKEYKARFQNPKQGTKLPRIVSPEWVQRAFKTPNLPYQALA